MAGEGVGRAIRRGAQAGRPAMRLPTHPAGSMEVIAVSVLLLAAGLVGLGAQAEPNRVRLPATLDGFVHYTTVTRGEVTEHIMTTPAAIEAIKAGRPVPAGTHFLLVD